MSRKTLIASSLAILLSLTSCAMPEQQRQALARETVTTALNVLFRFAAIATRPSTPSATVHKQQACTGQVGRVCLKKTEPSSKAAPPIQTVRQEQVIILPLVLGASFKVAPAAAAMDMADLKGAARERLAAVKLARDVRCAEQEARRALRFHYEIRTRNLPLPPAPPEPESQPEPEAVPAAPASVPAFVIIQTAG